LWLQRKNIRGNESHSLNVEFRFVVKRREKEEEKEKEREREREEEREIK